MANGSQHVRKVVSAPSTVPKINPLQSGFNQHSKDYYMCTPPLRYLNKLLQSCIKYRSPSLIKLLNSQPLIRVSFPYINPTNLSQTESNRTKISVENTDRQEPVLPPFPHSCSPYGGKKPHGFQLYRGIGGTASIPPEVIDPRPLALSRVWRQILSENANPGKILVL